MNYIVRVIAVLGAWSALVMMVIFDVYRIEQGKTLNGLVVTLALIAFVLSLPFYLLSLREPSVAFYHLAYWLPTGIGLVLYGLLGMSYVP